jgi:hypothetical protein
VQPWHESDTLITGMSIHLTAEPDATPPGEPTDSRWYVLHTRSRQEVILSNELRSMGLEHCLLLVGRRRHFAGWEAAVRVPLLAQYLFLHGSPLDAEFATHTHRVTEMTEVADGSQLAGELDAVCRAVNSGAPCEVVPLTPAGRRARVTRGPLSGVKGALQADKLLLPLTCLDKAVAVEVDAAFVAPVN